MSKKLSRFGGLMLIVSVNTQQMGKWHVMVGQVLVSDFWLFGFNVDSQCETQLIPNGQVTWYDRSAKQMGEWF